MSPILKKKYAAYSSKDQHINFQGLNILVKAGVFHPGLFFSTNTIIKYLEEIDLNKKKVLELGCGTGSISVWASKKGAAVTASDINQKALDNVKENAVRNDVAIESQKSDLFENLKVNDYDYVLINPPYYAEEAKNMDEKAWFCGEEFEYFQKLFGELDELKESTKLLMVLSEDCDIKSISKIAKANDLKLSLIYTSNSMLEHNSLYQITH